MDRGRCAAAGLDLELERDGVDVRSRAREREAGRATRAPSVTGVAGVPWVAFVDESATPQVRVAKQGALSWDLVGGSLTTTAGFQPSITTVAGVPYVANREHDKPPAAEKKGRRPARAVQGQEARQAQAVQRRAEEDVSAYAGTPGGFALST